MTIASGMIVLGMIVSGIIALKIGPREVALRWCDG
jgi:hypothetical protein